MKYIKLSILIVAFSCNNDEKKTKFNGQNSSIIITDSSNNVIVNQIDSANTDGQNSTVVIKNSNGNNVEVNQSNK